MYRNIEMSLFVEFLVTIVSLGFILATDALCHQEYDRRQAMSRFGSLFGMAMGGITAFSGCHDASAAHPVNPAEAVRRSAANIPGYGQTDVFYPRTLLGNWKATREILPTTTESSSPVFTLEYPVRFLQSIEDNAVVADRGWNQANLERAIRQASGGGISSTTLRTTADNSESEDSFMPIYQWSETNPNDLRLTFADGIPKDIKVTKRATEKTDETVFSSEFQRVTQDDDRGIPVITARRVMSKWKIVDVTTVEGIEVVYDMGAGGDPLKGPSAGGSDQNKILSKSRLRLSRIQ